MTVMNCRSYSLSKATPTPKGQAVGEPLADSDQSILPSDRAGEFDVYNSRHQFFIYRKNVRHHNQTKTPYAIFI